MKEALRTGVIEINSQKIHDEQWITAIIQNLELDGNDNVVSEKVRDGKLYRKVSDVALETVTIKDPVTNNITTLSVVGVGVAIKSLMIKWLLEDNPNSTYDELLGMVIKNDSSK